MSTPDDRIDAAVRAHLDAEAALVNAQAVLARVQARTATNALGHRRRFWVRCFGTGVGVALAASLLIGLFMTGNGPVADLPLSATELIAQAKSAHENAAIDRCYEVSADWNVVPFFKRFRFQPEIRQGKLWTRGDQFIMLSAVDDGPQWAWGQEQTGRVWLAPTRKQAMVFDKEELNEPLARFCELMSLRLVSTLGELLENYELLRKDPGIAQEPIRIEAMLSPIQVPQARFRKVELELDRTTKTVRKAVLHRYQNGESVGTLTFQLIETAQQTDEFYTLRGHLDSTAIVLDGKPLPNPTLNRSKLGAELLGRLEARPARNN
jgi:hypothetical protein